MPIKKNLSSLPALELEGIAPDPNPRFVTQLAKAWHKSYIEAGKDERAMSGDTPFRGSDAGSCSFQLALTLLERAGLGKKSNPPSLADLWRMNIGTMVHEALEEILPIAFPDAECEVVGTTENGEASFHADVLVKHQDGTKTLIEVKTINGTGFKSSAFGFAKKPAEGPRMNAILQGALAAEAFDCDELTIGYLALENLSVNEASRKGVDDLGRFSAEWTFTKEQFLPLAQAERARFRYIKGLVDIGQMPERSIPALPEGAVITNPRAGDWVVEENGVVVDIGSTWHCNYCWMQDHCASLTGG